MKNKYFIYLTILSFSQITAGCTVSGARPSNMAPTAESYERIETNKTLEQRIALGNITISEQASKATIIPLTANTLQTAIQSALLSSNYAVRDDQTPHLLLHATLIKMDAPYLAFNITTTSTINYELTSQDGATMLWQETIMMPYTAPFSESFNGEERVRLSVEKSIRENVTHMLVALSQIKFATTTSNPPKTQRTPINTQPTTKN